MTKKSTLSNHDHKFERNKNQRCGYNLFNLKKSFTTSLKTGRIPPVFSQIVSYSKVRKGKVERRGRDLLGEEWWKPDFLKEFKRRKYPRLFP